jgi:hypothetical protein
MADPERKGPGDVGLVFAAHNNHDPRCGRPPRVRNTDNPGLYHGYFENRYGEQFAFTFDRATRTGMVSGGDLGRDDPKPFTLGLLDEVLRSTRKVAAQVGGRHAMRSTPACDRRRARVGSSHRSDGKGRGPLATGLPGGLHCLRETAPRLSLKLAWSPTPA